MMTRPHHVVTMLGVFISLIVINFNLLEAKSYCSRNCSTVADGFENETGTRNYISCEVKGTACPSSGLNPTKPKLVDAGWYLYDHPIDHTPHIALNFTWGPTHDGLVEDLVGYSVTIIDLNSTVLSNHVVHYCLNTKLKFFKHVFANFYYDCYGHDDVDRVHPGNVFLVHISSLPLPHVEVDDSYKAFYIKVPTCDDWRLWNVTECVILRQFTASISDIVCHNRSITYKYNVPLEFGETAKLLICVGWDGGWDSCLEEIEFRNLPNRNGTISIGLPQKYEINENFTISVWGLEKSNLRDTKEFSFASCANSPNNIFQMVLIIVLITATCAGFCVLVLCYLRKNSKLKAVMQTHVTQSRLLQPTETPVESKTVLVLFVADCFAHERVVANFATFLQEEIGFKVIFELWEKKVHESTANWMEKSMKKADKLVIVLSPKAVQLMKDLSDGSYKPEVENLTDTFPPMIKHVKNDIFKCQNLGKYCFVTFEYYPITRHDVEINTCQVFNLMNDLETLVFRLTGQEKYRPGGSVQFAKAKKESYEESKCGSALLQSIDEFDPSLQSEPGSIIQPLDETFSKQVINLPPLGEIFETEEPFVSTQLSTTEIEESSAFASRAEDANLQIDRSGCFNVRLSNELKPIVIVEPSPILPQPPCEPLGSNSAFPSMVSYEMEQMDSEMLEDSIDEEFAETVTELAPLHEGDEDPLQLLMSFNRLDEQQPMLA